MQRDGDRERDTSPHDAQTLETIRLLAEDLLAIPTEYEPYVPGAQKSLSEKLAPFSAFDRLVAESLAALDAREKPAAAPHAGPSPAAAGTLSASAAPRESFSSARAGSASPAAAGGRLSVLLDQLQERARLRRQRGHTGSRLIKAEDFERREPSLGAADDENGR